MLSNVFHKTSMNAPGKIAIVTQHYAPDSTTTATYLTAIAEGLSSKYDVLVLSGTANSASEFPSKKGHPSVVEVSAWAPKKTALVRRVIAMVLFSVKMFFATFKHVTKNDVVLCVTTPFILPYAVILAAKLRKASTTLLIYDLYPEALVVAGLLQPTSFLARAIRFANGILFRALDAIITIGRDVEPLLLTYNGVESRQIKFIPNWVLLPIGYRHIDIDNRFRRMFPEKLVIGLSGNLGFTHCPNTVYEAARLLEDNANVHILLSGWGSGWERLTELCAKTPLSNATVFEPVPDSELEEFLSAADAWIIPYRRNAAGVSVPSRIYNLLAVGRPVIVSAEANSEAALMLKEDNIGWIVRPEDPFDLAETIRSAAADRQETLAKGRRASVAAQHYTYDRAIASYQQIIYDIVHSA